MPDDVSYRIKPDGKKRRRHLDEVEVTGVLAERRLPSGRRQIKLRKDERDMFAYRQKVERAVALFLDTETDHSWEQIAADLGISLMALKDMTKTQEFMEIYSQHFAELGHDPRSMGARAALADMLPSAVRQLRSLLTDGDTPPSVKMKAIEKVFDLNGIGPAKGGQMDRNELMNFLKEANISITQNNVQIPASPFEGDIAAYVEGRYEAIQAHEAGKAAALERQERDNEFPTMEISTPKNI